MAAAGQEFLRFQGGETSAAGGSFCGSIICSVFCRLDSPRISDTQVLATPNSLAIYLSRCLFALPSTGGALICTFSRSPYRPTSASRLALGCTWQCNKRVWLSCHWKWGKLYVAKSLDAGHQSWVKLCGCGEITDDNAQYVNQQKHQDG